MTQASLVRATGNQAQISDLREPISATPNLQALALEQVRFPKPLPLAALMAYSHSRSGEIIDLTSRVTPAGTLDWVAPEGTWTLYAVSLAGTASWLNARRRGERASSSIISRAKPFAAISPGSTTHFAGAVRWPASRAFFNDSYKVDDAQGEADQRRRCWRSFRSDAATICGTSFRTRSEEPGDDMAGACSPTTVGTPLGAAARRLYH